MKKILVLMIDDSKEDRYLFSRDLQMTGLDIKILEASGAEEGLQFFVDEAANREKYGELYPPEIVFLDVNMPKIDGHQFLEKFAALRKTTDLKTCVVMMLSSSGRQQDREKALAYDFVIDYLVKGSCSMEDLKALIQSAVDG